MARIHLIGAESPLRQACRRVLQHAGHDLTISGPRTPGTASYDATIDIATWRPLPTLSVTTADAASTTTIISGPLFEWIDSWLRRITVGPVSPIPEIRLQPIGAMALAAAIEREIATGRLPPEGRHLGGPETRTLKSLAQSWVSTHQRGTRLVEVAPRGRYLRKRALALETQFPTTDSSTWEQFLTGDDNSASSDAAGQIGSSPPTPPLGQGLNAARTPTTKRGGGAMAHDTTASPLRVSTADEILASLDRESVVVQRRVAGGFSALIHEEVTVWSDGRLTITTADSEIARHEIGRARVARLLADILATGIADVPAKPAVRPTMADGPATSLAVRINEGDQHRVDVRSTVGPGRGLPEPLVAASELIADLVRQSCSPPAEG